MRATGTTLLQENKRLDIHKRIRYPLRIFTVSFIPRSIGYKLSSKILF